MKQVVIMPGGFHPFHAGHAALYNSAREAFPAAEVYVAATNDTSTRPFPFAIKEKLAKLAGVEPGHFVQVKSPFQALEITQKFNPDDTQLIFVRSQKDANKPPQPGGIKKNGEPAYLQPYNDNSTAPMSQHGYMAYLPTVEFGPGMTSATEIRTAWPELNEKRRTALVMSLYPATQKNPKLAANVVKMLDTAIGTENINVTENIENAKVFQNTRTGKWIAWTMLGKNEIREQGDTKEEALDNLEKTVSNKISTRKNVSGNITTVGFNGPFVSGILRMSGQKFFARFEDGKLLISDVSMPGFRPVSNGVPSPVGQFSKNDINAAGLTISSRYDIIPDGNLSNGIQIFNLKHHSDVVDANDRLTRNTPSLTIQMAGRNMEENQGWAATYEADGLTAGTGVTGGMHATYQDRYNQPIDERDITSKLGTKRDMGKSVRKWRKERGLDEQDYLDEDKVDPITSAAVDFYQDKVGDVRPGPVKDYKEIARKLLGQTENPTMRKKIMDILVQGNKNPYIQGGVITTVGALLAGGILSSASKMGLTPQQTNILLQSVLNTVIPTMVSRVNGKSWKDTLKYTLASAGIGTGIAAMTETGRKK